MLKGLFFIFILVASFSAEARSLKNGKSKSGSNLRFDVAALAPEVLPFGVRYGLVPWHFIRGYYAFLTRFHRESRVSQDHVLGVEGRVLSEEGKQNKLCRFYSVLLYR